METSDGHDGPCPVSNSLKPKSRGDSIGEGPWLLNQDSAKLEIRGYPIINQKVCERVSSRASICSIARKPYYKTLEFENVL